ncbi:hypothetical protein C8R43DRAFT_1125605 [Mycena crocata]|nr:hypothetical protein C8R43DRAFT_1125605 [Mycena crocata]
MSPADLFRASCSSTADYQRVSAYMLDQPYSLVDTTRGERSGSFHRIPNEMLCEIVNLLTIRDKIRFGTTSKLHRSIVNRTLYTTASRCLRAFDTSIIDMQFLQSCTGTLVAGFVLKNLLGILPEYHKIEFQEKEAGRNTLDLYCAAFKGPAVANFMHNATGYSHAVYEGGFDAVNAIRRVYSLNDRGMPRINIFETYSDQPIDAILCLPTTADIGAWMLDRIWHAYPEATLCGITMTTPNRLPVRTLPAQQRTWDTLYRSTREGFEIETEFPHPHKCAHNLNCPISWRRSTDEGCLSIRLPTLPFSAHRTEPIWRVPSVSWTLGAASMCRNWHADANSNARSFRYHEYEFWKSALQQLIETEQRPV